MKKIYTLLMVFGLTLFTTSCGMSEELDDAKQALKELQPVLKEQSDCYKQFNLLTDQILDDFDTDLEKKPVTGLYVEKKGALYANYTEREELLASMKKNDKQILKIQKELNQIVKRQGVDVPNDQLASIARSVEIIRKNFEVFSILAESGLEQEDALYSNLPAVTEKDNKHYLIQQTYGSTHTIAEEAKMNIIYTLNLSNDFKSILSKK